MADNKVTPGSLLFVFLLTLGLIVFQLIGHRSETQDLQRRVGQLEQQCKP